MCFYYIDQCTQHFIILKVNGQNVVGISDKEISEIIDSAGNVVTVTIVPTYIYGHMMKK